MKDDLTSRVETVLSDRFRIEREIGSGGMGAVYQVTDLGRGGQHALKVLKPEIGSALGPDRFLREIEIAAQLSHPNLVAITDRGTAGGLLYYTMPLIEGPTLRARIEGGGPLPIDEAVILNSQIAAALAHVHQQGVVHRDIKPENILLSGERALLTDFGIARLLRKDGAERITSTGVVIGTPAYMSPEQSAGGAVDERSDQYSLACVLYEMLAGEPPFSGRESRAVLARHMLDPVPRLRTIRPTVPAALEQVIDRALAKQPADRWPSITAFAEAVAAGARSTSVEAPAKWSWRRWSAVAAAILALGIGALLVVRGVGLDNPSPSPELIAVLPFRIEGDLAGRSSPAGLLTLIEARITGVGDWRVVTRPEGSPVTAPVGTEAALRAAGRLGAGLVLTGQLFAGADEIAIDASLREVRTGREVARVDHLTAPPARLVGALDRAVLTLLARAGGEPEYRVPGLVTRPPEAVKAYLGGAARYRRGRYQAAAVEFERALAADSTFALGGLMAFQAHQLAGQESQAGAGIEAALEYETALAEPDRRFLAALIGPPSPIAIAIRTLSRLADSFPDARETSLALARQLYDWGPATGIPDAHQRAANVVEGLLRADSALAPALEIMMDLAASRGDTTAVRRAAGTYFILDTMADRRDYVRWRMATALNLPERTTFARAMIQQAPNGVLTRVMTTAQLDASALDDAELAGTELRRRARTQADAWLAAQSGRELALNRGRPSQAPSWPPGQVFTVPIEPLYQVAEAIYWDGDSTRAAKVVTERRTSLGNVLPGPAADDPRFMDACTIGLWSASRGDWLQVRNAARQLERARGAEALSGGAWYIPLCQALILAELKSGTGQPDAAQSLEHLDSMVVLRPPTNNYIVAAANLTVARLMEARGDVARALAAVRRRSYRPEFGVPALSTMLREEGRLAGLLGQREAAITAYEKYLALRRDSDSGLSGQTDSVRRALNGLQSTQRR